MTISFSRQFLKQAKKLDGKLRQKLQEAIVLFEKNPLYPQLRNHPLKGPYREYRSIDVTGDLRVLYTVRGEEEVIFDAVGTHRQLYG